MTAEPRTRWQKSTWTDAIRVGHCEGNQRVTSLEHDSRANRSAERQCSLFPEIPKARPKTSTSYTTDRILKLQKCQDVSRAKTTDTMAERHSDRRRTCWSLRRWPLSDILRARQQSEPKCRKASIRKGNSLSRTRASRSRQPSRTPLGEDNLAGWEASTTSMT